MIYDLITLPLSILRKQVVMYAEVHKGSTILDVGTGMGGQAFAFAKRGYTVVGVDISEPMVEKAKQKNSYEHVSFHMADATNLPYPSNHFTCTCAFFTLHEMPIQMMKKVLSEMARVTDPQGTVMIADFIPVNDSVIGTVVYRFLRLFEPQWFSKFVHINFRALLENVGIVVENQYPFLWGIGTILKGSVSGC